LRFLPASRTGSVADGYGNRCASHGIRSPHRGANVACRTQRKAKRRGAMQRYNAPNGCGVTSNSHT
jgi:hypothetical protein